MILPVNKSLESANATFHERLYSFCLRCRSVEKLAIPKFDLKLFLFTNIR